MTHRLITAAIILVAVVVLLVLGAVVALDATNMAPWSCPTKDSCTVDYRHDGRWHVIPTVP